MDVSEFLASKPDLELRVAVLDLSAIAYASYHSVYQSMKKDKDRVISKEPPTLVETSDLSGRDGIKLLDVLNDAIQIASSRGIPATEVISGTSWSPSWDVWGGCFGEIIPVIEGLDNHPIAIEAMNRALCKWYLEKYPEYSEWTMDRALMTIYKIADQLNSHLIIACSDLPSEKHRMPPALQVQADFTHAKGPIGLPSRLVDIFVKDVRTTLAEQSNKLGFVCLGFEGMEADTMAYMLTRVSPEWYTSILSNDYFNSDDMVRTPDHWNHEIKCRTDVATRDYDWLMAVSDHCSFLNLNGYKLTTKQDLHDAFKLPSYEDIRPHILSSKCVYGDSGDGIEGLDGLGPAKFKSFTSWDSKFEYGEELYKPSGNGVKSMITPYEPLSNEELEGAISRIEEQRAKFRNQAFIPKLQEGWDRLIAGVDFGQRTWDRMNLNQPFELYCKEVEGQDCIFAEMHHVSKLPEEEQLQATFGFKFMKWVHHLVDHQVGNILTTTEGEFDEAIRESLRGTAGSRNVKTLKVRYQQRVAGLTRFQKSIKSK